MHRNYSEQARPSYFPSTDISYDQNLSNRDNNPQSIHYSSKSNPRRIAFNGGYQEPENYRILYPRNTRLESRNLTPPSQVRGPEISSTRPPPPIRHFHYSYPINDHRDFLNPQEEIERSLTYPPQHHTRDRSRLGAHDSSHLWRSGRSGGRRPHQVDVEATSASDRRIYDQIPSTSAFASASRTRDDDYHRNLPAHRDRHAAAAHEWRYVYSPPTSPDIPSVSIEEYLSCDDNVSTSSPSIHLHASDREGMDNIRGSAEYFHDASSAHNPVSHDIHPKETRSIALNHGLFPPPPVPPSLSNSDEEALLSPLNPPEELDRILQMQLFYDEISRASGSSNDTFGLEYWEIVKIREIFHQAVFYLEEFFLPSYVRNNFPTRLLRISTMKLLSMQSQAAISIISAKLRRAAREKIQLLMEMEMPDIVSHLQKAVEEEGRYAILSHRWCSSEVTFTEIQRFEDVTLDAVEELIHHCERNNHYLKNTSILSELVEIRHQGPSTVEANGGDILAALAKLIKTANLYQSHINAGFKKLVEFCHVAFVEHGTDLVWIDTCCIDKSSSAELDESIRSMFLWYRNSSVCIIHLGATSGTDPLRHDPWFRRGWTLQELLAPKVLKFYDAEWTPITRARQREYKIEVVNGDEAANSSDLESQCSDSLSSSDATPDEDDDAYIMKEVSKITKIPLNELMNFEPGLKDIRGRLAWASKRETTRIEDQAYSLLGIFDINIPIAYGEGKNAFYRLQEAIMQRSNDRNLFLWSGTASSGLSLLASGPRCFASGYDTIEEDMQLDNDSSISNPPPPHFTLTNHGLSIAMSMYDEESTDKWMEGIVERDADMKYRLAVLGYAQHEDSLTPIFMLLTRHWERGHIYYRRHSWTPRAMSHAKFPAPSNIEIIYIR